MAFVVDQVFLANLFISCLIRANDVLGQFFIDLSTEFLTYNTNLSQNNSKSLSALTNNQLHPHYFKSGKMFIDINIKPKGLKALQPRPKERGITA